MVEGLSCALVDKTAGWPASARAVRTRRDLRFVFGCTHCRTPWSPSRARSESKIRMRLTPPPRKRCAALRSPTPACSTPIPRRSPVQSSRPTPLHVVRAGWIPLEQEVDSLNQRLEVPFPASVLPA